MEAFSQSLPLALLLAVAVFHVRRGSRTKPDPESNKPHIGGGSGDGGGAD